MTRVRAAALLAAFALAAFAAHPAAWQGDAAALVVTAEYDGIIHPIAAEFFDDLVTRADTSGAALVILTLRTPGGLLESTRTIVSRLIASRTPVVVFVGPSGARAASAGFLITVAADVAVMAPGTHIGAAHPVAAGGGGRPEEGADAIAATKAVEDTAAYARTLAAARHRNATLAAAAVEQSRAFTEGEALAAEPPLIDFIAGDVDAIVRELDGREITRFDGRRVTLRTAGARIETMDMTWRQEWLSVIAHPQLAYILLSLGMLGLVIELWNPGAVVPGVLGGLSLLLAFFAFQVLPLNLTGILLIVFGVGLLALELKFPSFGVLGIGGTIALLTGSLMVTREVPGVRVGYGVVIPIVLSLAGIFLFLGRLALTAQRARPVSGVEAMVGQQALAITPLASGAPGQIAVRGEIWRAASPIPIAAGEHVRIVSIEGLTMNVEPSGIDPASRGGV